MPASSDGAGEGTRLYLLALGKHHGHGPRRQRQQIVARETPRLSDQPIDLEGVGEGWCGRLAEGNAG
ncbi:MAG TPA: hypothetical protein VK898_16180 [Chloroflexota bacterium]|nr:hypothetical protein [Chloroflexota bacterium]